MRRTLLTLPLLFLAGCVNDLGAVEAEHDDDHDEVAVSADEILAQWQTQGEWRVSPPLETPGGATRVGVLVGLSGPGVMPVIEARPLEGGEPIGEWGAIEETWGEEDQHVGIAELGGVADGAQLRIHASALTELSMLRWTAAIPQPDDGAPIDPELATQSEALRRELGGLGIVTRESWGARATRCTSGDSRKTRIAIHHTVTPSSDPLRQVRGIQRYHMDSRGWCDVGYHFLVGSDGRIYEGRPLHLLGAHVLNNNSGNIGISFVGCFHTSGCSGMGSTTPPETMVDAAGRLVGNLSRLYGIAIDTTRVKGHRDHSGQSTSCPGNNLHSRLGTIRTVARGATGTSTGGTPAGGTPAGGTPAGASCTHTYGGRYSHLACSAGYQCCNGGWRTRESGCGTCACVEATGERGCSAPSGPPAGASCTHTYGGRYANTACSAGYQCCDGAWRVRGSGCGACYCVEETGQRGCGL